MIIKILILAQEDERVNLEGRLTSYFGSAPRVRTRGDVIILARDFKGEEYKAFVGFLRNMPRLVRRVKRFKSGSLVVNHRPVLRALQ